MTALSGPPDMKHVDRWFAMTNRLRTEGTRHLLSAAEAAGVRRFIAQSFAGWANGREGAGLRSEDDPLDDSPVPSQRETLAAIRYLELAVTSAPLTGIVLRYGGLCGPGAFEELIAMLRKRMVPVIGGGAGVTSWIHVDDAAAATVAALEHGERGSYNLVDDDPAPVSEWLPQLAAAVGAKPPLRVPAWLWRLLAGDAAVRMMTETRGSSNAKARRERRRRRRADAYLRYTRAIDEGVRIDSLESYRCAVVTRLSIDSLRSARVRREQYVGLWLPEPVLTDGGFLAHPHDESPESESLSMAFLLLERLTPVERAVFLLHDVFGYPHQQVAEMVGKTETNIRRIASRARQGTHAGRPRYEGSTEERDRLATRFFAAVTDGDIDGLVSMLSDDVGVHGDGGGNAPQWTQPIDGPSRVSRLLAGLGRRLVESGLHLERREINGQPGALVMDASGNLISVFVLEIGHGAVQAVRSVINPEKLRHIAPVADVWALVRRAPRAPGMKSASRRRFS
jgi:RNA polymerase sigma-70 factor (ECF subfamily)